MKLPRDISGEKLVKALDKIGYVKTRQTGSHIRLTRKTTTNEPHITIPDHNPLRIGTFSNILKDIAVNLNISREELLENLFG